MVIPLLHTASADCGSAGHAGLGTHQGMETLRDTGENQETDRCHEHDGYPIHPIPRDNIFVHFQTPIGINKFIERFYAVFQEVATRF